MPAAFCAASELFQGEGDLCSYCFGRSPYFHCTRGSIPEHLCEDLFGNLGVLVQPLGFCLPYMKVLSVGCLCLLTCAKEERLHQDCPALALVVQEYEETVWQLVTES